ncbi:MAG: Ketopantoate reductase ApbA/PanE domain protein [Aeromicrobium sp.]|nr:Ketopantoate reductase ApbA/PanE domain protein [Aeromicrobium sp.]
MTRYVVIGAGALGGLLAAELYTRGVESLLIARGAHGEAIRAGGLRIRRPAGTDVVRVPIASGPDEVNLRPGDVLVLGVKTQDVETVLQAWSWLPVEGGGVAADLPVLTLQNGLATEDVVLRRFGEVYAATAWIAASYLSPGEIVSPSWPTVGIIWLGRHHSGTDERAQQIAADLRGARFAATAVDDIGSWKAHKLRGNITNGLDLFTGSADDLAEAGALLVAELDAVYAAAGIHPIEPESAVAEVPTLDIGTVPGHEHHRSTWQSFARGVGSEIDYLNGEVTLLGRLHGVATPVNSALQRALGQRSATGGSTTPIAVSVLLETARQLIS